VIRPACSRWPRSPGAAEPHLHHSAVDRSVGQNCPLTSRASRDARAAGHRS
jgi:hypothetical protein